MDGIYSMTGSIKMKRAPMLACVSLFASLAIVAGCSPKPRPPANIEGLTIEDTVVTKESSGLRLLAGKLHNNGLAQSPAGRMEITLYDHKGDLIGSTYLNVEPCASGADQPFEIPLQPTAQGFKLEKVVPR